MIFDEAGGGRGVRGEVGPRAGHADDALQAIGDIGRAGVAQEQAAAAVARDCDGECPRSFRLSTRKSGSNDQTGGPTKLRDAQVNAAFEFGNQGRDLLSVICGPVRLRQQVVNDVESTGREQCQCLR